jgi:hypothetical protein
MLKEKITVIKDNLKFSELPAVLQESLIHGMADDLLSRNISETDKTLHHDRDSAYAMAKLHFTEWSDYKYVHYNSSIYGWRVSEIGKEGWR